MVGRARGRQDVAPLLSPWKSLGKVRPAFLVGGKRDGLVQGPFGAMRPCGRIETAARPCMEGAELAGEQASGCHVAPA